MEPVSKTESKVFGVSWRGWITAAIVYTVCAMSISQTEVKEPLYSISLICIGWYFGQKDKQ